ncbi:MAG: SEC-C domain-containing protein, partial [Spirochaetaceae bacterium]|nr:SEC-C domain-containing protein [Spirochaetaceae bacterium]
FNYLLKAEDLKKYSSKPEKLEQDIVTGLVKDIDDKEELIGHDFFNQFIRIQYLQFIDKMWLDHLENMESLREAVYLRHYAQKNPLTEYKLEGFEIFDTMVDKIREDIASRVHLVRIQSAENKTQTARNVTMSASHGSLGAFDATRRQPAQTTASVAGEKVTVVRSTPKVGRNDPCPCGSGKKYKHCHGR